MRYAMWGRHSQSWISFQGRVIVHDDKGEMEFLFPGSVVRPISGLREEDMMTIKDHPGCIDFQWPIKREDFW
jgi:hypothetical protein